MTKEVRRTDFQDNDGRTRTVTTYRYSRNFFRGGYETRMSLPPHGQRTSSSFEIGAIGRYRSARAAEQTAINEVKQREERLSHY